MKRRVTFTMMTYTDGTRSIYGVFRGWLSGTEKPLEQQRISLKTAEHVASVEHVQERGKPRQRFDYYAAAKAHETPEAPAFDWDRERARIEAEALESAQAGEHT